MLNPIKLIESVGYLGIFAIVFAESGLFFGFFLPGDSLLLTAGLLASQNFLNLFILIPLIFTAAVLGDNVGYWFGNKVGPPIFNRPNSRFFKRQNLLKAKEFYDKHGAVTITIARFMPFIRTFAPIVAGAVAMNYRVFFFFNLLGGVIWGIGVTVVGYLIGYFFGQVEGLERYFSILVLVVIFVSALPAMIHVWNENRHEIFAWLRGLISRKPPTASKVRQTTDEQ
ncbi:MAG: VTT domain-containing protein [Chloroflexi bacterium]|nr:VTT domain-containing protein [Chloroflexota bacterium]